MRINIGTSGWFYDHWRKVFYPPELTTLNRLRFYAEHFSTVEINNTFYRIPTAEAVQNWVKQTPKNFIFSVKASRYITHIKRLTDYKKSLPNFFKTVTLLEGKLGPILFQLPPSFKKNQERLEEFIKALPAKHLYVFEFRHPTWYDDEIYQLLHKNKIALCISDLNGKLTPLEVTTEFTYLRLHGPGHAYIGSYPDSQLKKWEKRIHGWAEKRISTYCYFDNDEKGCAVKDALRLKKRFNL